MGYSFRLTARVLLYALSHRQDNTYHGLCYTSRGALAGTRNSSMASKENTTTPEEPIVQIIIIIIIIIIIRYIYIYIYIYKIK